MLKCNNYYDSRGIKRNISSLSNKIEGATTFKPYSGRQNKIRESSINFKLLKACNLLKLHYNPTSRE